MQAQKTKPKVFGIGCPRTGTTTLHRCMEILGYQHATWSRELFQTAIVKGEIEPVLQAAEQFESFDDLPWCALYQELDQRFPQSKFILTMRKDSQTWLKSRLAHAVRLGHRLNSDGSEPIAMQHARSSVRWPRDINHYEQHNKEVQSYFATDPDSLLVLCWENGDGWKQICAFLEQPIPRLPFPHQNKTGALLRLKSFFLWIVNRT